MHPSKIIHTYMICWYMFSPLENCVNFVSLFQGSDSHVEDIAQFPSVSLWTPFVISLFLNSVVHNNCNRHRSKRQSRRFNSCKLDCIHKTFIYIIWWVIKMVMKKRVKYCELIHICSYLCMVRDRMDYKWAKTKLMFHLL